MQLHFNSSVAGRLPVGWSTMKITVLQLLEGKVAEGIHDKEYAKSNLSWMDINLNRISQGVGFKHHMPKSCGGSLLI